MRLRLAVLAFAVTACTSADPPRAPVQPGESTATPAPVAASAPPAASSGAAAKPPAPPALAALEQIKHDARALDPLVTSAFAHRFLAAAAALPPITTRVVYKTKDKKRWFTAKEAAALPAGERSGLDEVKVDEELYYNTKYGSPLSYARSLDVLAEAKLIPEGGGKIIDFGYGYAGHLRLLASLGFEATGVDVDPMLRVIYTEPGDLGPIAAFGDAKKGGSVRLLDGRFPADAKIQRAAGNGYDVFISKNTLKKGYIHPDRPADSKYLINLEVSDRTFLGAVHDSLKSRGAFLIYNVCPALTPPDKPFIPWSDGRSPWTEEQFKAAKFEVLVYNKDETAVFRTIGKTLGWDQGEDAMDLEHDLSVIYTLVRRVD
jgi:hypothetical protein